MLMSRIRGRGWSQPALAASVVIGVLLVLSVVDYLFNAMINPVFTLASGGLPAVVAGLAMNRPRRQPLPDPRAPRPRHMQVRA